MGRNNGFNHEWTRIFTSEKLGVPPMQALFKKARSEITDKQQLRFDLKGPGTSQDLLLFLRWVRG
jgi:hypothetical protein